MTFPYQMPHPDQKKASIDVDKALGHGVCALIESALRGDPEQVKACSKRLADRFERAGNLTAAARIRALVRRSSIDQ
ncbi:MAG: hypothetical protein JO069_02080 [Verrucomicrobia bacterium]|nr:hypothetical protein [Verrucomicrobiota bacterium]